MIEDGRKSCATVSNMTSKIDGDNNMQQVHSEPDTSSVTTTDSDFNGRHSSFSGYDPSRLSGEGSPMMMSPWNQNTPFTNASWSNASINNNKDEKTSQNNNNNVLPQNGLIGSLVREEGHIYSLAVRNDILYTGSDSKNIRVWKSMKEFAAFKSNSGLVKTIIISGDKIFTGHQDGKVRVWKINPKNSSIHKRTGTLPTFFDIFKASLKPSNYVEVKRNKTCLWIKHSDAISCLTMSEDKEFLYSASWDTTFKVWRIENNKCLESVKAHDDAVNCIVASVDGMVFTGSADGSVKAWRRKVEGRTVRHILVQELLNQENAVNALAVNETGSILYCGTAGAVVNYWTCDNELTLLFGGALRGHKMGVLCLAAAGNLVFSGSADKAICVWRREGKNHTCLSVLSGHTGPVKCLAVEEDKESTREGRRWIVYSGSLDKSVKVWSVTDVSPDLTRQQTESNSWDSIPSAKY